MNRIYYHKVDYFNREGTGWQKAKAIFLRHKGIAAQEGSDRHCADRRLPTHDNCLQGCDGSKEGVNAAAEISFNGINITSSMGRNTEYQFISTDTAEIVSLLTTAYEKITGITVHPASPEHLFIRWMGNIIIQERVLNNYTCNQNIPSRAEGRNLDALGELFLEQTRPGAKPARCTIRFEISEAQLFAVLVPAGTRVTDTGGVLIWQTEADIYVPAGETSVDAEVVCQTSGTVGNGYVPGQIDTIMDLYDYCTKCVNNTASDTGADMATDEEYYELMRASMDGYSCAGAGAAGTRILRPGLGGYDLLGRAAGCVSARGAESRCAACCGGQRV